MHSPSLSIPNIAYAPVSFACCAFFWRFFSASRPLFAAFPSFDAAALASACDARSVADTAGSQLNRSERLATDPFDKADWHDLVDVSDASDPVRSLLIGIVCPTRDMLPWLAMRSSS